MSRPNKPRQRKVRTSSDDRYLEDRRKEAKRLYVEDQRSLQEIADRFGVTRERVRQYLEDMGVERRSAGHSYREIRAKRESPVDLDVFED